MNWIEFIKIFGAVMIILYLIIGVDDIIWFILALISGFFHRKGEMTIILILTL